MDRGWEMYRNFSDDLNMVVLIDGGSASAFYGDGVTLSELTSIGSFFCVNSL